MNSQNIDTRMILTTPASQLNRNRSRMMSRATRPTVRIYAQRLAGIRKAGNLTQTEVAKILDTDQCTVSRIENRDDLLLSTLRQCLAATGTVHAKIVMEKPRRSRCRRRSRPGAGG